MVSSHIILAIGWILFCALHSALASSKFKQFVEPRIRHQFKYYRLYYSVFAVASFAGIIILLFLIDSYKVFKPTQFTRITGSLVAAGGLVVMSICIVKYFFQVSGIKGLIETKVTNQLMITGVHKIVRHPLYAGTFMFIWGLFILVPSLSLLIVDTIITTYTLIGLRFEEQKLEKEFGDAYRIYKQKVPMIIPKFTW